MTVILVFLLLTSGILATKYFLRNAGLLEGLGVTVFLSITVVPFININCALLNKSYISNNFTLLTSIISIVFFGVLLVFTGKNNLKREKPIIVSRNGLSILILAILLAIFLSFYYTNKEFLLSLGSYFIKGDAECFYMQTFETISDLQPDFKGSLNNNAYEIICTPGNILFTSTLVPIFKLYSFKMLYIAFLFLLFVFTYLIIKKLIGNGIIAAITAFFALLNPYILSVEVLDRNVMALAISAVIIYLVLAHKDKTFLHGLVFGILAGTGLRFIPILFIIPILILYYRERLNFKSYLLFITAFIITFTFNLPHLYFHGFHSLGETSSSLRLIIEAFTKWQRTPFLPFPNPLFYAINILNYFGYLVFAIIFFGAFKCWKTDKKLFCALSLMFLSVFFILSYQRNWLEGDKYRIMISGFLPLYIFLAYGLKAIFMDKGFLKKLAALSVCLLSTVIFARINSGIDFSEDLGFYNRRLLYQKESQAYYRLSKGYLLNVGLLPGYKRLSYKLNLEDKAKEEMIVFNRLFFRGELPGLNKFKNFYQLWQGDFLRYNKPYRQDSASPLYSYVKIDFEKLGTRLEFLVEKVEYTDICAIDLESDNNLFDVYYADLKVSWQEEVLPVSVILNKDETGYLKELDIDLNAFIILGRDSGVFDSIYPINFKANPLPERPMLSMGMESFPLYSEKNTMIFHLPRDLKVVIRNWFINEKGMPYKVDSWCIKPDKSGNYKAEFFYNEPEGYL